MFDPTSRYQALATATWTAPDGRAVTYVRRRFLPRPDELAVIREHVVQPGDRLDRIAARHLGDPAQAWRIADAHRVLRTDDLTAEPGRRLRITLPPGTTSSGPTGGPA
ncbi:LysM peptidoglycan-binding domain-containing protein [Streptomyces roseoverticillatus]|uniref:hypothetical protein n=1 Tax=Streptomyces roseoverticillatus TaxID=66429 RepID=UPI001F1880B0|nr:hypothetical protein [Streptomyces roseoverticillatus]MCF3101827.1 LysM peptidoglycan-binding domain-containing protein [Streptomyces roseoverticillatus]